MRIGTREFHTKEHTYIMGILNITPDSFSDGGRYQSVDAALRQAEQMIRDGADLIDIGGESTRPGYVQITEDEEIARITPMIEAVKQHFDIPVSADTYKGAVAEAAILAGADMINDIWGLKYDPKMASVIAEYQVAYCLMHNRKEQSYHDFWQDLLADVRESLALAERASIKPDRIILDPGVGFAKSYEQNLEVIRHMDRLHELGYPLLLGTSRKSVVGLTLDLPVGERLEGTLVTTTAAVQQGAAFVRVHDVKENKRAIQMAEAIYKRK